ncbi:MAG: NAD-dependent epimerase/dehydratase family protein [Burkholderiales bacterium]|nr:NAD-dependent epimerase/dehydratase family protein [Burkholderiales bacterium]
MHTILGAGGTIGTELARQLAKAGHRVRLVARNPKPVEGIGETVSADISDLDQTVRAVSGSTVVYLVAGLKYDADVWRELWPRVMANAIEACKRAKAKLVFFDNVYMYGKVEGPMTEETPFNPCSTKGEIRARIATMLLDEMKAGGLEAIIARSADFYGPDAKSSVLNLLVFDKLAKGSTAMWLVNDSVPHSFTFTPDAAKSLVALANSPPAWNQTWHVPTAPNPPLGRQYVGMIAKQFGVAPKYRVLGRPMLKVAGWFDADIRESYEMLYQSDSPYILDSTKYSKAFGVEPTSHAEGIRRTSSLPNKRPAG